MLTVTKMDDLSSQMFIYLDLSFIAVLENKSKGHFILQTICIVT